MDKEGIGRHQGMHALSGKQGNGAAKVPQLASHTVMPRNAAIRPSSAIKAIRSLRAAASRLVIAKRITLTCDSLPPLLTKQTGKLRAVFRRRCERSVANRRRPHSFRRRRRPKDDLMVGFEEHREPGVAHAAGYSTVTEYAIRFRTSAY
jgi:hypothetical protein